MDLLRYNEWGDEDLLIGVSGPSVDDYFKVPDELHDDGLGVPMPKTCSTSFDTARYGCLIALLVLVGLGFVARYLLTGYDDELGITIDEPVAEVVVEPDVVVPEEKPSVQVEEEVTVTEEDYLATFGLQYQTKMEFLQKSFRWDDESEIGLSLGYNFYEGFGLFYSDKEQQPGLTAEVVPEIKLRGTVASYHWGDPLQNMELFGNTVFECGTIVDGRRTVCASGAPIEGDVLIVIVFLDGSVPQDDPGFLYTYGLVLDTDGDPGDDYQARANFEWDSYQGTDYWIELSGGPGDAGPIWELFATDFGAGDPRGTTVSGARAVIWEDMIIFFVPEGDLGGGHGHAYRVTTFATSVDAPFDPAVSAVDAMPGAPEFGLYPIPEQKLMAEE